MLTGAGFKQFNCSNRFSHLIALFDELPLVLRAYLLLGQFFNLIFQLFHLVIFDACIRADKAQFNTKACEQIHIGIGNPHKGEQRDDVAAPVIQQQFVAGEKQEEGGDIMAKAILTGEEVKEFALPDGLAGLAARFAVLAGLAEYLFLGDGPRDAGDGYRQDE